MKPKYFYIAYNARLVDFFRNSLEGLHHLCEQNPLAEIDKLKSKWPIEAVIVEISGAFKEANEINRLLRELKELDILIFLVIHSVGNHKYQVEINGFTDQPDDVFYLGTNYSHLPAQINEICKKMALTVKNKKQLNPPIILNTSVFKIPRWKRSFDIVFSTLSLIFLSPVLLLTALAIRIESKGPVFYTSKRVGRGYQIFNFYKFRSMYINADKSVDALIEKNQYATETVNDGSENLTEDKTAGPLLIGEEDVIFEQEYLDREKKKKEASFFKIANDPRITRVGKFIRNSSIDELLQLFNILKGDMSVVGNRPLPLYEAETLTSDQWIERFLAPAGLTGLWQVTKRAKSTSMSADERKQLDIEYSRNYSFTGDLKIILQTIPALLQHENV